jgi:hypothetical protein
LSSKTKELFLSTISTVIVEREDGSMLRIYMLAL